MINYRPFSVWGIYDSVADRYSRIFLRNGEDSYEVDLKTDVLTPIANNPVLGHCMMEITNNKGIPQLKRGEKILELSEFFSDSLVWNIMALMDNSFTKVILPDNQVVLYKEVSRQEFFKDGFKIIEKKLLSNDNCSYDSDGTVFSDIRKKTAPRIIDKTKRKGKR